jgi:hypothetical protein
LKRDDSDEEEEEEEEPEPVPRFALSELEPINVTGSQSRAPSSRGIGSRANNYDALSADCCFMMTNTFFR